MKTLQSLAELPALVGQEVGVSDWLTVTQEQVNLFAQATHDHQWIHVDVARAKAGPFGAPIAHGYLTLSLISKFLPQIVKVSGIKMGLNYGTDKVRFPVAVKAGAKIRASGELVAAERTRDGAVQTTV